MDPHKARIVKRLTVIAVVVLVASGCQGYNDKRGRGGAPINLPSDDSPAEVVNFPDKFHNVAFKCMGVNGIYTHTREAAPVVVPNDPMCLDGDS